MNFTGRLGLQLMVQSVMAILSKWHFSFSEWLLTIFLRHRYKDGPLCGYWMEHHTLRPWEEISVTKSLYLNIRVLKSECIGKAIAIPCLRMSWKLLASLGDQQPRVWKFRTNGSLSSMLNDFNYRIYKSFRFLKKDDITLGSHFIGNYMRAPNQNHASKNLCPSWRIKTYETHTYFSR